MKKVIALVLALSVGFGTSALMAKKAKKFEGTVTYTITIGGDPSVASAMDMMPAEMLVATLKTKGQRSVMSVMGQKIYLDLKKKIQTSMIDLSMLGMGTYCIENPYQADTGGFQPTYTGETKALCGHTAEKTTISNNGTTIDIWITRDIALETGVPLLPWLGGLVPLQFDIQSSSPGVGNITITLTASEVKQQKVSADELVPPDGCQPITADELQTLLKSLQNFGDEEY